MRSKLLKTFIANAIKHPLEQSTIVYLTGDEVVEALFALNTRFSENIVQIRSIPYNAFFEKEADAAIEAEVLQHKDWQQLSAGAWRVLLERLIQAVVVAQANQLHGNPLIPVPDDLPRDAWTGVALIFLMYAMKLPFPVVDRSDFSFPLGGIQGSLTRQ